MKLQNMLESLVKVIEVPMKTVLVRDLKKVGNYRKSKEKCVVANISRAPGRLDIALELVKKK